MSTSFQFWDFVWCAGCMHAITVSVSSYVDPSCCVWKMFPRKYPPPPTLTIFAPPFTYRSLNPERKALMKTSHLGRSVSMSLSLCPLSICGSLCYFSSTERISFSEQAEQCSHLWDGSQSLGVFLLVCSFSTILMVCFFLGP